MDDNFYKDKYFKQLDERLGKIENTLSSINAKVLYIYATYTADTPPASPAHDVIMFE